MKFKRLISVVLLICMSVSLVSCKSSASKQVVTNLMTALTTYDLNAIAKCVEDIPDNSGTAYIHDIYSEDYYVDLYSIANENLEYSIVSANSKEVKLKVKMPDIYSLYKSTLTSLLSQAFSNDAVQKYILNEENDAQVMILALMINEINENGIDTIEEEITLTMTKINGEYKVKTDDQLKLLLSDKLSLSQVMPEEEETVDTTTEG